MKKQNQTLNTVNAKKNTLLSFRTLLELYRLRKKHRLDKRSKPTVLNLNIIDICNSKCTMCNIWKQEESLEITPDQLVTILSDPLYSNLSHVGVTGGEPTLRNDLPEIYAKIIRTLPSLKGLSIITNAIEKDNVCQNIAEISKICGDNGKSFSAMISIDGLGETHDRVRGIKGNFQSAIEVFNFCKNELEIPTSFGCTISKVNAWEMDDFLYYVKKQDMYGRFRVAEFINRLYNQDRDKIIRNFDDDETYNLVLFFEKIKRTFEKGSTIKRTYSSIQNMLLGGERTIGCPYHNDGVVLGAKGQINYCAPKSVDIGNGLESSSLAIYQRNYSKKQDIANKHCKDCIHDYHSAITYPERVKELKEELYRKYLTIANQDAACRIARLLKSIPKVAGHYRVFIVGWYGTETVGDKAILGGIVDQYKERYGDALELVIGSLFPFITERTCYELGIEAKVVSTKTFDLLRYAKSSDEVVMGGGPLMDLHELYVPLIGFKIARQNNRKATVFGCGLGPLTKAPFQKAVQQILSLTTEVMLRDTGSIQLAKDYGIANASLSGDFAKPYIEKRFGLEIQQKPDNVISCFLRDWTYEYSRDISYQEFLALKLRFEQGIAHLIKSKAQELGISKIRFEHMHNFVVGNDDRDFSRYFVDTYFADDAELDIEINKKLSTVESIARAMKASRHNICMRFHSVLFAHTLGTPFTAIDYTKGGKILNYMKDNEILANLVTVEELAGR